MEKANKTEFLKIILFTTVIGLWLYWLWMRRNLYRFAFKFPGVMGLPIIGSFHTLKHPDNILPAFEQIIDETKQHTLCVWLGPQPCLLTDEPAFIEKVLASPQLLNKAKNFYSPIYNILNGGLIASPAEEWHHNRKLINPCFNHNVLVSFLPIFNKSKKLALLKLDTLVGNGEHKLSEMLIQITIGASFETTMGKVMKEGDAVDKRVVKQIIYMLKSVILQGTLSFVYLSGIISLSKRYRKYRKELSHIVNELVLKKQSHLNESVIKPKNTTIKTNKQSDDTLLTIKKTPTIFIDLALQIYQNQQFSWNDLLSESYTIVASSFETSATGILSTLIMLAMHPEVQEKLYEEIVNIFPDKNFEMQYEHMEQLPYLDMVIREVLRLMPSVPIIGRHVVQDTQLTNDLLLPKNLQILISIFHLHRRTDIWGPDASKFNPDNFLPENLTEKHSHAYIPFSKGTRNCIGWRYAVLSIKVMISGLVRNYTFTTTYKYEDLKFLTHLVLKFLVEPKIEVHRR